MSCPRNILRASTVLDRKRRLGNHLPSIRSNNMYSQNTIRFLIRNKLDHPLRIHIRLCSTVGAERECPNIVLYSRFLEFLFGLADPGDFGVRVDDAGDGAVVDVPVAGFDVFDGCDAFFFGFVGEHGAEGDVADTADVGLGSAVFGVDNNTAFVVCFNSDGF